MTRWAILYNPIAGSFRPQRLEAMQAALRGQGVETLALPSEHAGHAVELARKMEGVDRVAAYGGDGHLREVAKGLLGREIPLIFLPGGTGNSMANELKIGMNPVKAALASLGGTIHPVRPGLLDGEPFMNMAGIGFDGMVVYLLSNTLKARLGSFAYVLAGFQALAHRHPRMRIICGDREWNSRWTVASRTMMYGGFMKIHPRAHLTAPDLGLTAVNGWMLAPFGVGRLLLRLPVRGPGLVLREFQSFRVVSEEPVHAQIDGDHVRAGTDFEISISSQSVPFCFPKG